MFYDDSLCSLYAARFLVFTQAACKEEGAIAEAGDVLGKFVVDRSFGCIRRQCGWVLLLCMLSLLGHVCKIS